MVAFDTTFLTLLLIPNAPHPVRDAKARVEFLISDLHGRGEKIVVSTPALAEILVKSGKARNAILQELTKSAKFVLAPFDVRAAVELSLMADAAFTRKDKRSGTKGTWAKVKYDRQIVAISKVVGASKIYSEDADLCRLARSDGLEAFTVDQIKIPEPAQGYFFKSP